MLLDLLFPRRCYGCNALGSYFCHSCLAALPVLPIKSSNIPQLQGIVSIFPYHSLLKRSLVDLKYAFVTDQVAELLSLTSRRLRQHYPHLLSYWQNNNFTLIPLPLHFFRQNWRGFNQSIVIGRLLAQSLGLNFISDYLLRSRSAPPQVSLPKSARFHNLDSAFSLNPAYPSSLTKIIIFDDVITTGSTIKSAARSINPGSSSEVWALSIAGSLSGRI